jgi:uridine phosphorylase
VAFEIKKGNPIATVFATRDVIRRWTKVVLPSTPQIAEKIAELQRESPKIGYHFEYDLQRRLVYTRHPGMFSVG